MVYFIRSMVLAVGILVSAAEGAITLTPASLQPAGHTAWDSDALTGIVGTTRQLKIVDERTPWANFNWFYFDTQKDGFPGGTGTSTNDFLVFIPANGNGFTATHAIPVDVNLALFNDAEDGSGTKGTGPNSILNPMDSYLNSNPPFNYTSIGASQFLKYYLADPTQSYEYVVNGETSVLGSGCIGFIFIDDNHTGANFDYNDMIICIKGCVNNSECSDGNLCNGAEICQSGTCVPGTPGTCLNPPVCRTATGASCDPQTGVCNYPALPDGTSCSDGLYCNGSEVCGNGACQPGTPINCADGVMCTVDHCDEANDRCKNKPEDLRCNDGLYCNGEEYCDAVLNCIAGTPPNCDDGIACTADSCNESNDTCNHVPNDSLCNDTNPCTDDACVPGTGCVSTPDDSNSCDDGLFCNGPETCVGGACEPGVNPCDDGVACTIDACDENTDTCTNTPNHSACDNGQFCDGVEVCDALQGCLAGTPVNCSHLDGQCVAGVCDEGSDACVTQPANNGMSCNDGLFCTIGEVCVGGSCSGGGPRICDDNVACTVDVCNETKDKCNHTPNDSLCNNGLYCDGTETCDPTLGCQPGGGDPCTFPTKCDEVTDRCVLCTTNAQCDDGLYCNGVETCDVGAGVCQSGTAPCGSDGVPCTADSCDEINDVCLHLPDDDACDDGLFCNGAEACDPINGCQPGTNPCPGDGIPCTVDSCDETNDVCTSTPNNSLCNDGLFCNGVETCSPTQGCLAGTPIDCSLLNDQCNLGVCNEDADACVRQAANQNLPCDDGLFCTVGERCGNGKCNGGSPLDCSDQIACTIDTCNETTDQCVRTPQHSLCNDMNPCTDDLCVVGTGCIATPDDTNTCDDLLFCTGTESCVAGVCESSGSPCVDTDPCTIESCIESTDTCDFDCPTPGITCPPDKTFECDAVGEFGDPIVDDDCSPMPTVVCQEQVIPGKLPQERTIVRTCRVTNACGNIAECTHRIAVVDTTPPVITCPPDLEFECSAIGDFGVAIVTDNCNPTPIVTVETITIVNDCRPPQTAGISPPPKLSTTNTYTASDGAQTVATGGTGNTAQCVQHVDIFDTRPPVILDCAASITRCSGMPLDFTPPTCSDLCGPCTMVCTRSDGQPIDGAAPFEPITITCVSLDECNNESAPCITAVNVEYCEGIPTVSEWGLVVLALSLLIGAKIYFGSRRAAA